MGLFLSTLLLFLADGMGVSSEPQAVQPHQPGATHELIASAESQG